MFVSCGKDNGKQETDSKSSAEFSWKSELKISEIPDTPIKGLLDGRPFVFKYINFEQWRGSGDNVLNFYENAPNNSCGYVEGGRSIHFLHKAGLLDSGEVLKASFEKNLDGYIAYFDTTGSANETGVGSLAWNCALVITSKDDKIVKGKIVICFKDDKKSYIAGSFEAIRCFN
jgi:hypothetical protein